MKKRAHVLFKTLDGCVQASIDPFRINLACLLKKKIAT